MSNNIENLMRQWLKTDNPYDYKDYYCETRDVFQTRLDSMIQFLINHNVVEESVYTIAAIAGEIGNNSFDHNIGNWPNIMGIFFGYEFSEIDLKICLADRGQGILKTLTRVLPELNTDSEALKIAFTKKISGRAPEDRGNGLKFVKESVKSINLELILKSGNAQAKLNHQMKINQIDEDINGCIAIIKYKINN